MGWLFGNEDKCKSVTFGGKKPIRAGLRGRPGPPLARAEAIMAGPQRNDRGGRHSRGRSTLSKQADYMETYDTYWKALVENEDGTLNKDQVARELADALALQGHLSEIYMEVSNGAVSKPFTLPSVVIAMYHDSLTEAADDAINELIDAIEKGGTGLPVSAAEVVSLIRELTGVEARTAAR